LSLAHVTAEIYTADALARDDTRRYRVAAADMRRIRLRGDERGAMRRHDMPRHTAMLADAAVPCRSADTSAAIAVLILLF
jgi:hypothetical protein